MSRLTLALSLWAGLASAWLPAQSFDSLTFHQNAQRTGWNPLETVLTPANVSSSFKLLWNSPVLDTVTIGSTTYAPHLYATPLYVDNLLVTAGPYTNRHFRALVAASSNGWVYAINTFRNTTGGPLVRVGTILWKKHLGLPTPIPALDGGVPLGVLSTPVIDPAASPPRIYVTATIAGSPANWKVFALDLGSGQVQPGWPLVIDDATLAPINQNGPATFETATSVSQRAALTLGPGGNRLYLGFGGYKDGAPGWMVVVDTRTPALFSAFSGAPSTVAFANAGMWGSGGPALDTAGVMYETTGNSPSGPSPGVWGESLLVWPATGQLQLKGTYTTWNYCQQDMSDIDLGGDSPMIVPDLNPSSTSTPLLVAFGSKQGNAYLVDRGHLPGGLTTRQPCSTDSTTDKSLLPPGPQPQFGARGPLNVFGPYSETGDNHDLAKMRTTPAYFQNAAGASFVFISGSTKASTTSSVVVPPSLARLRIVTSPGQPAYLAVDATDTVLKFLGPGSPVLSSNGTSNLIVWVLDENQQRSAPLLGTGVAHPVLYAVDGTTMNLLFQSAPNELDIGGKYSCPVVTRGVVFVGTDRIQAYGL